MKVIVLCSLAAALVVFACGFKQTEAVDCNVSELAPCQDAVVGGTPPTPECCVKAKEQTPCACKYIKDPDLGKYFKGPNAQKTIKACGLEWPSCKAN